MIKKKKKRISTKDYSEYRKNTTKEGLEFQDYIVDLAWQNGLVIAQYSSKKYQYSKGESRTGIEVKYDRQRKKTGNIYIEVEEKAEPRAGNYVASGIYAGNHWLYLIGDYEVVYVFATKNLIRLWEADQKRTGKRQLEAKEKPTSRGFLLSKWFADQHAALVLYPEKGKK